MSHRSHGDDGAASILVIAMMGAMIATTLLVVAVATAHSAMLGVAAAADSSALAAADVMAGAVPGTPCLAALSAAEINGVELDSCELAGLSARVSVHREIFGVRVVGSARAGPRRSRPTIPLPAPAPADSLGLGTEPR